MCVCVCLWGIRQCKTESYLKLKKRQMSEESAKEGAVDEERKGTEISHLKVN